VLVRDGGVIAPGYNAELDEWRALADGATDYLDKLEIREREKLGLDTLKVGYNAVHGYFIQISRGQSHHAPIHYVRRQTLKNAERYIIPELKEYEDKVLTAKGKALALATFAGAAELAAQSSESLEVLRQRVTSKGGTTHAAITSMEAAGVKPAIMAAMQAAAARGRELGDELGAD